MKNIFRALGLALAISLTRADDTATTTALSNPEVQTALDYGLDLLLGRINKRGHVDASLLSQTIKNIEDQDLGNDIHDYRFEVQLVSPVGDLVIADFTIQNNGQTGENKLVESHVDFQQATNYGQTTLKAGDIQLNAAEVQTDSLVQDIFADELQQVIKTGVSAGALPDPDCQAVGTPVVLRREENGLDILSYDIDVAGSNGQVSHISFTVSHDPATDARQIVESSYATISTQASESFETSVETSSTRNLRKAK